MRVINETSSKEAVVTFLPFKGNATLVGILAIAEGENETKSRALIVEMASTILQVTLYKVEHDNVIVDSSVSINLESLIGEYSTICTDACSAVMGPIIFAVCVVIFSWAGWLAPIICGGLTAAMVLFLCNALCGEQLPTACELGCAAACGAVCATCPTQDVGPLCVPCESLCNTGCNMFIWTILLGIIGGCY